MVGRSAYHNYNDAAELASFKPDADSPSTHYVYDANGRRVAKLAPSGQVEISVYSRAGQLVYSDSDCALVRTDHIRLGRALVASRKQTCSGDTDKDGIPDCDELCGGLDPEDDSDATIDSDGDGINNIDEHKANTLFLYADSDDDGLTDKAELDGTTDPRNADSDSDGLDDGREIALGTDPNATDTDGDGMADGFEVDFELNPKVDDAHADSDQDGVSNLIESLYGTDPTDSTSTVSLSPASTLRWTYNTESEAEGDAKRAPLIGPGGNIVAFGSVHVLDWRGKKRRRDNTENAAGGLISESGAIVGSSGVNTIRAWRISDGVELWAYSSGDVAHGVLARGPDYRIYVRSADVGGHRIHAIDSRTGGMIWVSDPLKAVWQKGAVGPDGTIYVINRHSYPDQALTALSPTDGSVLWTYRPGVAFNAPMALGIDGSIYLRAAGKSLHAVNADGTRKWVVEAPADLRSAPVVGADGSLYLGGRGAVYAFKADGTPKWTHDAFYDEVVEGFVGQLAVAGDGALYYSISGSRDAYDTIRRGWVGALNPKTGEAVGKRRQLTAQAHGFSLGDDGTLVVATYSCHPKTNGSCLREAKIRAVAGGPAGLAKSSWPIPGHDNQNSNHLPACGPQDSDGDGIPDCEELRAGLDPTRIEDGASDPDGDGLTNAREFENKTHYYNADSDGDGLNDQAEIALGLDPRSADTDDDGMRDGYEVTHNLRARIKDETLDPDGDGFTNAQEHDAGSDPQDKWSVPTGKVVWSYDPGSASTVAPVMGHQNWVYFAAKNRVYRFRAVTPYQEPTVFHTADADVEHLMSGHNRVFVVSKNSMVALDSAGGEQWRFPPTGRLTGKMGRPALATSGTAYLPVGSFNNTPSKLYAIDSAGSKKWGVEPAVQGAEFGAPSIGVDGTIHLGLTDGTSGAILALSPADGGTLRTHPVNKAISAAPAIDSMGNVLATSHTCHRVWRLTPTNDLTAITVLKRNMSGPICKALSSPVFGADNYLYVTKAGIDRIFRPFGGIDSEVGKVNSYWNVSVASVASSGGTLYLITTSNEVVAVDLNASKAIWRSPPLGPKPNPPLLAPDGTLFVMADKLYAIPTSSGGPAKQWPMVGKDIGRSGNAAVNSAVPHNEAPKVRMGSPSAGSTHYTDEKVTLIATASDPEDGDLGAAIRWTSSLDGDLGTGAQLAEPLSAGQHQITASVTDKDGESTMARVTISVKNRPKVARLASLTASHSAYHVPEGTAITFTATASGGDGSYEYLCVVRNRAGKAIIRNWSPANTCTWNTTGYSSWQYVYVFVRSPGQLERPHRRMTYYRVSPAGAATSVSLDADQGGVVDSGTPINFTAKVPHPGTFEYQFSLYRIGSGSSWEIKRAWGRGSSYTLDTRSVSGQCYIRVLARGVGVSQDPESATRQFLIKMSAAATNVVLSADPSDSEIEEGTTVSFEASASGGSGGYEYQFHTSESRGGPTTLVRDWAANPSWDWSTDGIPGGDRYVWVSARVKGLSQTPVRAFRLFRVTPKAAATSVTLQSMPEWGRVHAGTRVTYTAQAEGGTGVYEYKFVYYAKTDNYKMVSVQPWSSSRTWIMDTTGRIDRHMVRVYARSKGVQQPAVTEGLELIVLPPGSPLALDLQASHPSPQPVSTAITFTASTTGTTEDVEYRWVLQSPSGGYRGKVTQDWSTLASWTWRPLANDKGQSWLRVYARAKGSNHPGIETDLLYTLNQ